jgi:hypothetical protein
MKTRSKKRLTAKAVSSMDMLSESTKLHQFDKVDEDAIEILRKKLLGAYISVLGDLQIWNDEFSKVIVGLQRARVEAEALKLVQDKTWLQYCELRDAHQSAMQRVVSLSARKLEAERSVNSAHNKKGMLFEHVYHLSALVDLT